MLLIHSLSHWTGMGWAQLAISSGGVQSYLLSSGADSSKLIHSHVWMPVLVFPQDSHYLPRDQSRCGIKAAIFKKTCMAFRPRLRNHDMSLLPYCVGPSKSQGSLQSQSIKKSNTSHIAKVLVSRELWFTGATPIIRVRAVCWGTASSTASVPLLFP